MLEAKKEIFKKNIKWFKANYGASHFTDPMVDLIWEELKEFSPKQIDSIFHKMIGESEFAPKIGTFRTWASCLREKIRQFEREQERKDSKDFWEGTFHSDEVKSIVQTIGLRMKGLVNDDDWRQFKQILKTAADKSPAKCKTCDDTGVFFDPEFRPVKCFGLGHLPQPRRV